MLVCSVRRNGLAPFRGGLVGGGSSEIHILKERIVMGSREVNHTRFGMSTICHVVWLLWLDMPHTALDSWI